MFFFCEFYKTFQKLFLKNNFGRLLSKQVSLQKIPKLPVWKFCGMEQFAQSFGRIAQSYAETKSLHKISAPGK